MLASGHHRSRFWSLCRRGSMQRSGELSNHRTRRGFLEKRSKALASVLRDAMEVGVKFGACVVFAFHPDELGSAYADRVLIAQCRDLFGIYFLMYMDREDQQPRGLNHAEVVTQIPAMTRVIDPQDLILECGWSEFAIGDYQLSEFEAVSLAVRIR